MDRQRTTGPRRRSGRRLLALALIGPLLGVAACSDDGGEGSSVADGRTPSGSADDPDDADPDAASSGTLELEPSTTTTTTPEVTALLALLPEDAPLPGFTSADDVLGAGPLDLDAAAAAESDVDAERSLLETRRFQRGASRAWIDPAEDVIYLAVYDFATAEDAEAYLRDGAETLQARGAAGFDVPEVEGAVGFTTVEESAAGTFTAHAVAFTSGERWVLALVGSPGSGRTADDARTVAVDQAARLA